MLGEFKTDMQTQVRVKKEYVCTQKPSYVTFFRQKKDKSSNNPIHVILAHQKATLKSITIELEKLLLMVQYY